MVPPALNLSGASGLIIMLPGMTIAAHSHTSRQQFLSCPRSWYLSRVLRIEKARDPAGLRMGKAFATAMETPRDTVVAINQYYEDLIHDALTSGRPYDVDKLEQERSTLRVLAPEYVNRYGTGSNLASRLNAAAIQTEREVAFDDPILGVGRLDARCRIVGTGRYVGIEDKLMTAGFWRSADEKKLAIDSQVTAYFAAMRAAGTPLERMLYRVTLKPTIKRDTRKGESWQQFEDRFKARIHGDPAYTFREYELYRTDTQLDEFVDRVLRVNQMIGAARRAEKTFGEQAWPANMGTACTQFGECEFLDLCTGHKAGYQLKPQRIKLHQQAKHALTVAAAAFTDTHIADLARAMGKPEHVARHAMRSLVKHGFATPHQVGRRKVYTVTPAGRDHLA